MRFRVRIDRRRSWSLTEIIHGSRCLKMLAKPWLVMSVSKMVFNKSSKLVAVCSYKLLLWSCVRSAIGSAGPVVDCSGWACDAAFAADLASFLPSSSWVGTAKAKKLSVDDLMMRKRSASVGFGFSLTMLAQILKHIDLTSF